MKTFTIRDLFFSKLAKRIWFTVFILFIFRLGAMIPTPLINGEALRSYMESSSGAGGLFDFINLIGGGSFKRFSVFAMSVSPYITASIIVQLLSQDVIPILSRWGKEGVNGKKKSHMLTRVLSLILAFVQAIAIALGFNAYTNGTLLTITNGDYTPVILVAIILTAGTAILIWLGDLITKHGIGNGISIIILAGIISQLPSEIMNIWNTYMVEGATATNYATMILVYLILLLLVVIVVYMQEATRKIPIQYANVTAKESAVSDKNYLPLKINSAGVIPVIFASAIISLPVTVAGFFSATDWGKWVTENLTLTANWGFALYVVMTIAFTFFYAYVQIDPEKMSENLGKQNAFIPNVRPGEETRKYISGVLGRLTCSGAIYLAVVVSIPLILSRVAGINVIIGGTSIIILAGVALETVKQMRMQSSSRSYTNFLE